MKKISRVILSSILVAILAFGSLSTAFAASADAIEWIDGYDKFTYYYTGKEIKEGINAISFLDVTGNDIFSEELEEGGEMELPIGYPLYYDFNVTKSGYYHLDISDASASYGIPASFNGSKANGYCDLILYGEEMDSIVYVEKGKTIIGIFFSASSTDVLFEKTFTVEYLGAKITDYKVDADKLDDFIIGKTIWEEKIGEFGFTTDCKITFDSSKTIDIADVYITGTCSKTPKSGKNSGVISLLGNKKNIEFTAAYLDDIIKSVEVSNADRYTTFVTDYTGETRYSPLNNETITVNFKNGTSSSARLTDGQGEIALSNGLVVPVYAGLSMNEKGGYDFVITVYDEVYSKTATTVTEGSFFDNIGYLTDDNFDAFSRAGSDFITGFTYLLVDPEFSSISFNLIGQDLLSIFSNFMAFMSHYLSF